MEDGQFDEIVPQSSHDNTVGRLQNSFRKMQQALNERMDSLQQQADTIRRQNEELQQTKQQAEETVRQKFRFVKHVIQQMRMPLNVITGFADVLGGSNAEEITITEEELSSIMYLMTSNTINMNRMVLLLLDASETDATGRLSCTRTEEVSCNEISRDVIDHIVRHFPQASIRFETELQDCVQILTNRLFLLSVLIEPLYNAVLHSDGEHITLRVSQTATTVRFTVQDTGPGLPPEMPEPVFKPFREIDNLLIGTGIGLSLARRYAIGLGGSLIFDTDYHQGCSLAIELPK
jgi:signal transduction histidine kinase